MRKENPIPSNTEAVLIPQVKERNLNFELLRIVAMFMVVLLHVNLYGGGYSEVLNIMKIYPVFW